MADDKANDLVARFGLDTNPFRQGVSALKQEMNIIANETKLSLSQLGNYGSATDKLGIQSQGLAKQLQAQKAIVQTLSNAYKAQVERTGENTKASQTLRNDLIRAQTAEAGLTNSIERANKELHNQTKEQSKLKQSLGELKDGFGALGLLAANYLKGAIENAAKAEGSTARLKTLVVNQGVSWNKASKEVSAFTTDVMKMSTYSAGEAKAALTEMIGRHVKYGDALKLQNTLVDLAAGKNITLTESSDILADAYNGKTKALVKLGIVTKDDVKNGVSMEEIQKRINSQFGGSGAAQLNTYSGRMTQLQNIMNSTKTTIGTELLPYFISFGKVVSDIAIKVSDFIKTHKQLTAVILTSIAVFGSLIGGISLATKVIGILGPVIGGVTKAIKAFSMETMLATLKTTAIIAVIAALAGLAYEVVKHWKDVAPFFDGMWTAIKGVFDLGKDAVIISFDVLKTGIMEALNFVIQMITKEYDAVLGLLAKIPKIGGIFKDIKAGVDSMAKVMQTSTDNSAKSIGNMRSQMGKDGAQVKDGFNQMGKSLSGFGKLAGDIKNDVVGAFKGITSGATNTSGVVTGYGNDTTVALKKASDAAKNHAKEVKAAAAEHKKAAEEQAKDQKAIAKMYSDYSKERVKEAKASAVQQEQATKDMYDAELNAIDKLKAMQDKQKTDKANNTQIAYLQDRINRASDPMEKAGLQNELDKFKDKTSETESSNIFDTLKNKITAAKNNVGLTAAQITKNTGVDNTAMNTVLKMLSGINLLGSKPAIAGGAANITNHYNITIDAKNVKDFNSAVKTLNDLGVRAKKG